MLFRFSKGQASYKGHCSQECSKPRLCTECLQNFLIPDAVYLIGRFYHKQCSTRMKFPGKRNRKLKVNSHSRICKNVRGSVIANS